MGVALVVICLVLPLLLVEAVLRIRHYYRFGTADASLYAVRVDPVSGLTIPVAGQTRGSIHINSLGFRGPEISMPKPDNMMRLAFLGGSTTFCAEVSSNEMTWPHIVWKTLSEKWPNVRFDYANAGVPGYVVESSIRTLESRVKRLKPDVIIIYDGINDMSKDTRALAEQQGISRGKIDDAGLPGRLSLTWFLIEKNLEVWSRERKAASGTRHLVFDPVALSTGFQARLHELVLKARKVAPVVAVATSSMKVRRTQSPAEQLQACNTALYYNPYLTVASILATMAAYNQAVRSVAAETGIVLVDGEDTIPGDSRHFADSIHFRDPGSRLMAQRVTNSLLASRSFQQWVQQKSHN
jgi:lysophospholipase L1-like esterase